MLLLYVFQVQIANGCDVIVTTPDCLLRLMDRRVTDRYSDMDANVTDLFRLCHLVRC